MHLHIKQAKLGQLYANAYKFNHHGERRGNRDQHKWMHGDVQFEPATFSMLGGGIVLYRSDHVLCIET
jgi:hypothetical protein